jgi:hypothetical protein
METRAPHLLDLVRGFSVPTGAASQQVDRLAGGSYTFQVFFNTADIAVNDATYALALLNVPPRSRVSRDGQVTPRPAPAWPADAPCTDCGEKGRQPH